MLVDFLNIFVFMIVFVTTFFTEFTDASMPPKMMLA